MLLLRLMAAAMLTCCTSAYSMLGVDRSIYIHILYAWGPYVSIVLNHLLAVCLISHSKHHRQASLDSHTKHTVVLVNAAHDVCTCSVRQLLQAQLLEL